MEIEYRRFCSFTCNEAAVEEVPVNMSDDPNDIVNLPICTKHLALIRQEQANRVTIDNSN